jgi:3D (Asp-Asp-Asp) domain-containing protein
VGAGRSSELIQNSVGVPGTMPQVIARRLLHGAVCVVAVVLTAASAIAVKEARHANVSPLPLASVDQVDFAELARVPMARGVVEVKAPVMSVAALVSKSVEPVVVEKAARAGTAPKLELWPLGTRFFNGRPIRPVKTMKMVVTAYSPDWRSCGKSADGLTATLHSVQTNAHRLVAADPRVLAYGSMLTIPGYDRGNVVPVLDCGGAIKGNRLDLLFPTHEQALRWGKKTVTVTVWGYADGKPAPNPRKAREGKK